MSINKVTVLGAGNMGSQIAALLVNAGLQVKLLDLVIDQEDPNKLSKGAFDRITDKRKGLLFDASFAKNLSFGNFDQDLKEDDDSDLYIEAVSEVLEIKHDLWKNVASIAKDSAILATNTSGIPIEKIASVLTEEQASRFVGYHFFNPPRHMKLIEIIPHSKTSQATVERLEDFTSRKLGKGAVHAKDVSGFVANRIGVYALVDAMKRGEDLGYSITEVDAMTGLFLGRPKTATYRLNDLVGLDIAMHVAEGLLEDPAEKDFYVVPESLSKLVAAGALGNKVQHGYYKREGKNNLVYDFESGDYQAASKVDIPFLNELGRDLNKNLKAIFQSDDPAAQYMWDSLGNVLYYSAINVPKATDDYKNVDRAMVWGFNWKLGPFQIWDAIGFNEVKDRLKAKFGSLPKWIEDRNQGFYQDQEDISNVAGLNDYVKGTVWNHDKVSDLYEADNRLLIFVLRTPNNTITQELCGDIKEAVATLENEAYRGMVIYSEGKNFSLGANLDQIHDMINQGKQDSEIGDMIDQLHEGVLAMKHANKPVVTAMRGMALGGGCELVLYSPFVVAAAESYLGLVEMGVGVIPAGGGLAELAERVYLKNNERSQGIKDLQKAFNNVINAKVSKNAYDAKAMGILRDTDMIIANDELILEAALKKADLEASYNYVPKPVAEYAVEGSNYFAIAKADIQTLTSGNFASDYDATIATSAGKVLAGGDVPLNTVVNQRYLQSLEREGFIALTKNVKTSERIQHMLKTKKPLRN